MAQPKYGKITIANNKNYKIDNIDFKTQQVTVEERKNVYLTVNIKNVDFDFSEMTEEEIKAFKKLIL